MALFNGKRFEYSNPIQGLKTAEASGVRFFSSSSFTAPSRSNPAFEPTATRRLNFALGAKNMAEIFTFPTKDVRDWVSIEKVLKEIFSSAGVSENAKNILTSRIKIFWESLQLSYDLKFSVPPDYQAGVSNEINKFIGMLHEHNNKIFLNRVYTEIEICRLQGIL